MHNTYPTSYPETGLRVGQPWFSSRRGQWWYIFLRHRVQTSSGTNRASYPMGTGGSYSKGKAHGAWSWSLSPV